MCKNTDIKEGMTTTIPSPPPPRRQSSAALLGESLYQEIRLFLELAIPSTLISAGTNIAPLLIASYIGRRFGVEYLSGYTLANLTGNLCTFSILSGLFSASDTLGPQAFGISNYREVGLLAVRGFVVALAILFPINVVLYFYQEQILLSLGQDPEAALHAAKWYKIFIFSLPFAVLYNCIWKFLSAQHIMGPPTVISLLSCCVILPVGLEILTDRMGFMGSAYAYLNFQFWQAILLLGYLCWKRPHVAETWPASSTGCDLWRDAILNKEAVWEFVHLGLGGIFAQSEWLFWEALGLVVGLLGVLPLSVHTVPSQVTSFLCFGAFASGVALAIRMGVTLPHSVKKAKKLAMVSVIVITLLDGMVHLFVYYNAETIISFFTHDADVMALALRIWWKVCVFNFLVALFAMLAGVATGLGQQWALGYVNFFFLFVVGLPAIYYFAVVQEGGLDMVWTCILIPYLAINGVLIVMFATTDWYKVQQKIHSKEAELQLDHQESQPAEAQALLLGSPVMSYGAR